ncbi:MAG: hypothetical protein CVV21_06685 [Candidatus Goldiibacteriota bacterium HGW-Goldbacteria-1]|jgi:hypothetical protein|nr:MAG: hypothetical protein CVV21_06685 [Candidatus Goldiibacteriota bacterium HGW-Goldbacteria-1]
MKIVQLSVFLSNEKGRLFDVMDTLADAKINIRALSLAETADFGVLRMIVNDNEKAMDALKKNNIVVKTTEIIAVEVPDRPGGLAGVLAVFKESGVNIEYMYAFVEKKGNNALMVFRVDNIDLGIEALTDKKIKILQGKEIKNI